MRQFTAAAAALLMVGGGAAAITPAYAADRTCQGRAVTLVVTADSERLQGSEDADVIDVGAFDRVRVDGNGGDDVICATAGHGTIVDGGPGNDVLVDLPGTGEADSGPTTLLGGAAGDDTFIGGASTMLSYERSAAGVAIDLEAGTVVHPGGTDSIVGINRLGGSPHADTFHGSSGADFYGTGGGTGGDRVDTGAGADGVSAWNATVDLGPGDDTGSIRGGTMSGGEGDDDIVVGQEGTALGGPGDDHLSVTLDEDTAAEGRPVRLYGESGNDVLEPPISYSEDRGDCPKLCGRGVLDGGAGTDRLDLGYARRAVVDLRAGRLEVTGGRSVLAGIENVRGSMHGDVIRGDRHANRFDGNGGDDVLDGRAGPDRLYGGSGRDRAIGGPGRDRCVAERKSSC